MHDPWNPTPDEVRKWAYGPDAPEPCEDWDLALCWAQHERCYLELASDELCPKRRFILGILYLIVGDAVRSGFRSRQRPIIEGFLKVGNDYPHADVRLWQARSRELLDDPERFAYDLWCSGGYARG